MDTLRHATSGLPSEWVWTRPSRRELLVLALICTALLVAGLALIAQGAPLGHDESVYALRARYWAGHAPPVAWNDYRAEGLPILSAPLVWLGGSEPELRAVVLVTAVLLIVTTWGLARLLFDARTGLVAGALVAVTPATLAYGWQIALDVPSAALGLAATLVLAAASRSDRLRWWALWSVPLAAAATFVRYGAPLVVAAGMVGIGMARWRVLLRDWRRTLVVAASTVGVMTMILLVPAVTHSRRPPGLAFRARQVAKEIGAFESYGDLVGVIPSLFGPVVGVLLLIGLLTALVRVRRLPAASVAAVAISALVFVVGLNLSLAQVFTQYVVPLIPFVAIVAAAGLVLVIGDRRWGRSVLVVVLVAGVIPAWVGGREMVASFSERYDLIRAVGRELAERTRNECVVATSYSPQIGWYSECAAYSFTSTMREGELPRSLLLAPSARFGAGIPPGADAYVVLFNGGKRQPTGLGVSNILDYAEDVTLLGDRDEGPRQWGQIIDVGPTP